MGIFDGLLNRWGYIRKAEPKQAQAQPIPDFLNRTAGAEFYAMPDPHSFDGQIKLYQKLSWINGAITAKAQAAAGQALQVKRISGEDLEDIPNHELELMLYNPNPLQGRMEFLEATYNFLEITGNAYWWMNRPNENTTPAELWLLPSNMIKPVPDGKLFLKGYLYYPGDGSEIPLEPWEICHFKLFSGDSMFLGASRLSCVATQAWGDLGRTRNDAKLYNEDQGWLPAVMTFADFINDTDWERLKAEARSKANKRELMMLRGVGSGGVQWIQTNMSRNDMQFLESREFTRDEIYSIFAPGYASMITTSATEANAKSGKATFAEYAIWPLLTRTAERITKSILPSYGDNLRAEFEDPRTKDRVLELQEQQEYSKTHTLAEIRKEFYGDEPLGDDRDKLIPVQINAQTGDGTEKPVPPTLQPFAQPGQMPPQEAGQTDDNQQQAETQQEEDKPEDETGEEIKRWKRKALKRARAGKFGAVEFASDIIPADQHAAITAKLAEATTIEQVEAAFTVMVEPDWVSELRRANDLLERVMA